MARLGITALWLAVVLLCAGYVATDARVSTDLTAFMPASAGNDTDTLLLGELQKNSATRLLLLAVEGGTASERIRLSRQLTQALELEPGIRRVLNGDRGLDSATQDLLFRYRYLLTDGGRFDHDSLRSSLQERLIELASPLPLPDRNLLVADPTAAYRSVLLSMQPRTRPHMVDGVWVSPDGERALLLLELAEAGLDVQAQADAIQRIQNSFASLLPSQGATLIISGPARFAAEASRTIRAESQWLSGLGVGFLIVLLLVAYRSPRLLLISSLPLATAVVVATAVVMLLFGGIHGITLAFGMTILGVAVDYPLHLFSHWHGADDRQQHPALWPTFRLAVTTTLIGYLSLAWTNFTGLAQLGVYAAVGLVTAALVTRWLLPFWLPSQTMSRSVPGARLLARVKPGVRTAHLGLLAAVVIVGGFLMTVTARPSLWEHELEALAPVSAVERALDRELRLQMGAAEPGQLIVIEADTAQQALERSEALLPVLEGLRQDGTLQHYEAAARYLPSVQRQRLRQAQLPDRQALAAALDIALAGQGFRDGVFSPFLDSVADAKQLAPLTPEDVQATLLGLRVQQQLYEREGDWLAIIPLIGVHLPEQLAAALENASVPGAHYLDLRQFSARLMLAFRDEALGRLVWGGVAIVSVLALGLRSLRAAASVVSPIALACMATVTVLAASGQALSLFHLVALLLVGGVGLDYSLFFRRWSRLGGEPRTLHSLLVCVASTFGVFAILGSSELPVLSAIGRTVAIGVAFCFLLSFLFSAYARQKEVAQDTPTII